VNQPFATLLRRTLSRRRLLQAGAIGGAGLALPSVGVLADIGRSAAGAGLDFRPIAGSRADAVVVADGYTAEVVLRWGDPLWPDAAALDTAGLRRGALLEAGASAVQERQFGYNCDAVQFFPLDATGRRGLLCVNHEYTNDELMFPGRLGLGREGAAALGEWSRRHPEAARLELAAHGASVVEIRLERGQWRPQPGAPHTRRVTGTTPMELAGPARGHPLLRTRDDPTGTRVLGMLGNCAGGRTPWGTFLTAEENIDDYFGGYASWRGAHDGTADGRALREAHRRFPLLESSLHGWEHTEPRFDARHEPREALRFGWIVEIDPFDPASTIRKRTALGRFCHEGATCVLTRDGRVAVYSGDDDKFEYLYKFVSRDRCDPARRAANRDLLDAGVLHVARFDADGTGEWLPLVHGRGPLTAAGGFADQGEVLIRARAAADRLGATPMDRPEDVAVHPHDGRVYVAFTKNADREAKPARREVSGREIDVGVDVANPRPANEFGHVVEMIEENADAGARRFRWNVFLLAGEPHAATPIGCPDNLGFDPQGHLWIVTDGEQPRGDHNGAFAVPVSGAGRGELRRFMSAPRGAEVCGCEFTPDGETLFLAIQHPGEGGTVERAVSDWPDGGGRPPRPSVVAVRRSDGGRIGR
jgi:uncharacterized protein